MKAVGRIVAMFLLLLLPGCGGGGNDPTSVPTPTAAPVTTNIFSRTYVNTVPGNPDRLIDVGWQEVSVPNAGQVEVLFDWTFATTDIDLVVTDTTCTDEILAYNDQCMVLGADKAPASASKRARVVFQLTSATTIRVFVYYFTSNQESGVLNVFLTR